MMSLLTWQEIQYQEDEFSGQDCKVAVGAKAADGRQS